jgi:hypothetical protein
MIKTNKGQGLSMNTVIIGIIVLVVLIVLIAFFTGGTGTVVDKIKSIFGATTKGQDTAIALQACDNYCDQASELKDSQGPQYVKESPFCTSVFDLDYAPVDGNVDKDPGGKRIRYVCDSSNYNQQRITSSDQTLGVIASLNKKCGAIAQMC